MKILVISACMGNKATNTICEQNIKFDFIRLDDFNFPKRQNSLHPRMNGKIPKMMAWELYPDYDYYIWLDSSFSLKKNNSIEWFLNQIGSKEAAFFEHPSRRNVEEELVFMETLMNEGNQYLLKRYEGEPMRPQFEHYKSKGFIDDKLFACGCFIYNKKLVEKRDNVMKEWFVHNYLWSLQDQLSLPYVLQQYDTNYNIIKENIYSKMEKI